MRMRKIREIVLMGGAFETYGNVTTTAEFNIFADPHAAQLVLDFGVPVTMVPLDVTHQVILTGKHLDAEIGDTERSSYHSFSEMSREPLWNIINPTKDFMEPIFTMHFPSALLTHPEFFETVEAFVQVETSSDLTQGMTVADLRPERPRPKPNARVCIGVNAENLPSALL